MELFTKLFGELPAFVHRCFDRIVIHGYVTRLCRPEHVVYFFQKVVGVPVITKEILRQRTEAYQSQVEAFARNHKIPSNGRKSARARRIMSCARCVEWSGRTPTACTSSSKAWKSGPTFRIIIPKYPPKDPNYRVIANQRSRYTHYYFYIRDEVLGPIVMGVGSFFQGCSTLST